MEKCLSLFYYYNFLRLNCYLDCIVKEKYFLWLPIIQLAILNITENSILLLDGSFLLVNNKIEEISSVR